jgi:hypothetical protein
VSRGPDNSPVRYDRELGEFLLRCDDCSMEKAGPRFWPLTLEFWQPAQGLRRCRACLAVRRSVRDRARFSADADLRERKRLASKEYRQTMRKIYYKDAYARLKADPVRLAAKRAYERERQRQRRAQMREAA